MLVCLHKTTHKVILLLNLQYGLRSQVLCDIQRCQICEQGMHYNI